VPAMRRAGSPHRAGVATALVAAVSEAGLGVRPCNGRATRLQTGPTFSSGALTFTRWYLGRLGSRRHLGPGAVRRCHLGGATLPAPGIAFLRDESSVLYRRKAPDRFGGSQATFDAMDFLPRLLMHIPQPKLHTVGYYGEYSSVARAPVPSRETLSLRDLRHHRALRHLA
jgi:hypothetical protein